MSSINTPHTSLSKSLPIIKLSENFVKSLHIPHKKVEQLQPVFACHLSRYAVGGFSKSWLPRALIITQTGQILLIDTQDGRVTHEAALSLHESLSELQESKENKRLVHIILEPQSQSASTSILWIRITANASLFAAILRFQGPFEGLPLALLRVILFFIPQDYVSVQKYTEGGPLIKFIPKELCNISQEKGAGGVRSNNNNKSPHRSLLSPRSSKRYVAQIAVEEQKRLKMFTNKLAEQHIELNETHLNEKLTAEEIMPPHDLITSDSTISKQEKEEVIEESNNVNYNEEITEPMKTEMEESPKESLLYEVRNSSKELNMDKLENEDWISPEKDNISSFIFEDEKQQEKKYEKEEKIELKLEEVKKKIEDEIKLSNTTTSSPVELIIEYSNSNKDEFNERKSKKKKNKEFESKRIKHKVKREKIDVELLSNDEKENDEPKELIEEKKELGEDNIIHLSNSLSTEILRSNKEIKEEISSPVSALSDTLPPIIQESVEGKEDNQIINENSNPPLFEGSELPPPLPPTTFLRVDNVIDNEEPLITLNKNEDTLISPSSNVTGDEMIILQYPDSEALRVNGTHILSKYPLQRRLTDYRNHAYGYYDEDQQWRHIYQENIGRKSEPRTHRNPPTDIYTRGSNSPSQPRRTNEALKK